MAQWLMHQFSDAVQWVAGLVGQNMPLRIGGATEAVQDPQSLRLEVHLSLLLGDGAQLELETVSGPVLAVAMEALREGERRRVGVGRLVVVEGRAGRLTGTPRLWVAGNSGERIDVVHDLQIDGPAHNTPPIISLALCSSAVRSNAESDLTAAVLGQMHRSTAVLPCLHSMCAGCLAKTLAVSDRCPSCRALVDGAQPNFAMRGLIESVCAAHPGPGRKRKVEETLELNIAE